MTHTYKNKLNSQVLRYEKKIFKSEKSVSLSRINNPLLQLTNTFSFIRAATTSFGVLRHVSEHVPIIR